MASIDVNANAAKQTSPRSPPADQGGDGEDRISGLSDDVLVRILGLADIDARELVRTGVLSRRWRGLWTRVHHLCFMSPSPLELESAAGDVGRYVAFVKSVLAQRARSEASIDALAIPLFLLEECLRGQRPKFEPPAVEAAEAWIRYAVQHHVRGFYFNLRLPLDAVQPYEDSDLKRRVEERLKQLEDEINELENNPDEEQEADEQEDNPDEAPDEDEEYPNNNYEADEDQSDGDQGKDDDEEEDKPVIDLDELPSATKLEALYLWLSDARVRLPSTAVFASLEHLTLEFVELAPGGGHLLARLSSSACCPSLLRLRIAHVSFRRAGTRELVLDAGELLVLSMEGMHQLKSLELKTPSLLRLEITECSELRSLTVSTPALEEFTFERNRSPVAILGDLPCVWRIETGFVTHLFNNSNINDDKIGLLKRCSSSVTSLVAHLDVPSEIERHVGFDLIKDRMPQLPNVTSLAVNIHAIVERHSFGDGVASLLTRFNNLKYICLQLDELPAGCVKMDEYYSQDDDGDLAFTCNHVDNWESISSEVSMGSLREAGFKGMTGTGCELRFLQMVLASATVLERVTVSFSVNYNLEDSRMHYFLHTLLGDGTWTACEDDYGHSYVWTPCP